MTDEFLFKKEKLIERLGVHIEEWDNRAPLAARILSTLILNGKQGTTFDYLVTNLCASKSTISTHLNNLQSQKVICYHTKPGDRKKYFTVSPNHIIHSLNKMIETWEAERQLHLDIMEYKESYNNCHNNKEEFRFDLEFHTGYLSFLNEAGTAIKNIKEKLINKTDQQ